MLEQLSGPSIVREMKKEQREIVLAFVKVQKIFCLFVCLFFFVFLNLYVPSTIFQLNRDGSSWVEPVLS